MPEVCGDYLIVSPYVTLRNMCVSFDKKINGFYPVRERNDSGRIRVVTHGLASAHTHLGLYPVRGSLGLGLILDDWVKEEVWGWEKFLRSTPEASYYAALKALTDLLRSGVTAVADMHYNGDQVGKAALQVGVRVDLSTPIMDGGVYNSYDEGLHENLELVRRFKGSDMINVRLGPCTPRLLTPKQFKEVVDIAKDLGVGIHTHLAEVEKDVIHLRKEWGMSLNEFLHYTGVLEVDALVAHSIWVSQAIYGLIRNNVWVVNTPRSNTALGDGITPVLTFLGEGGNVALGVDVAPTYSIIDEMNAFLHLHYVGGRPLPPEKVFELATIGGYQALKLGTGRVETGEPADIVVWETPPDTYPASPIFLVVSGMSKPSEVYVGGELVLRDSKPLKAGISEETVSAKLEVFLKRFKSSDLAPP
ncbi:MAG: amidohydrolase family protein [Desulfurococcales archaeon]|nr:amidohydrolase family protein [Desulfurococcales archaeon]